MVVASSCGRNTNLRSTMKKQIKEGEGGILGSVEEGFDLALGLLTSTKT